MNYFWRKNLPTLMVGTLIAIIPWGVTLYQMNDYDYSPLDVKTTAQTTVVTLDEDGDAHFAERKTRDMIYHVSEQYLYYSSDDEDVTPDVHATKIDSATFSASVYDANDQLLFTHFGPGSQEYAGGVYFAYADAEGHNSLNETGGTYYAEEPDLAKWMFYNPDTWGNGTTFVQNYTIKGAALQYNDTAEFFWALAYTDYVKTTNVDVTVILPTNTLEISDVDAYIFGSNNARIVSIAKNDSGHIAIHITAKQLYPDEFISARIDFPREALTITDNTYGQMVNMDHLGNVVTYERYNQSQRRNYGIANLLAIIVGFACLVATAASLIYLYNKYDKEPKSAFYGEYYRELPAEYGPAIMGYLYDFKAVEKNSVTSTLMDLIRRKFISIDSGTESLTDAKVNYTLIYDRTRNQAELKQHERYLLKWFFDVIGGGKDSITLDEIDAFAASSEANAIRYENCNKTWVTLTTQVGENQGFFDNVKEAAQKGGGIIALLWIVGLLGLFLGFSDIGLWTRYVGGLMLGLAIVVTQYLTTIQRRSIKGNEDFVRWRAFKKFLSEFSNIKDYPMPGIAVWEHYMVYAVQFGIADLVEKQLRFKYRELGLEEELNRGTYLRYRGFYGIYSYHYLHSMTMARTVIQTAQAARAQASNSARGGGGHFGGGGGFGGHIGGGGGGGHFR